MMWIFLHHEGKMSFLSRRNTVISGDDGRSVLVVFTEVFFYLQPDSTGSKWNFVGVSAVHEKLRHLFLQNLFVFFFTGTHENSGLQSTIYCFWKDTKGFYDSLVGCSDKI